MSDELFVKPTPKLFNILSKISLHIGGVSMVDLNEFVKSIGDYCVERVKEDKKGDLEHKGDVYFVVNGVSMRGVIQEKLNEHLKEYHSPKRDEPMRWWQGMKCPVHHTDMGTVSATATRGEYLISWKCGCKFERENHIRYERP